MLERKRQARADAEQFERVGVDVGGRVTRAVDGSGIAGAAVLLSRWDIASGQAPRPGEPTLPLSTMTDANGGSMPWILAATASRPPRPASSP